MAFGALCSGKHALKARSDNKNREEEAPQQQKVKAVILAGGLGTRLRPYTLLLPKPMLPVGTKPILEHILEWLRENGISEVVVSTGYLGKMIQLYFGDGSELGVKIEYSGVTKPMGIAGQLRAAKEKLGDRFVCLYGDAILDFDLEKVLRFHEEKKALVTMTLMRYETQLKYGMIDVQPDGGISAWREKPRIQGDINVGCYVMQRDFLKYIPEGKIYGMKEAFDEAMDNGERICALRMDGTFVDIGDRKSYLEANELYLQKYGEVP
jgi:mannose-1-phosphate guanylyltransferase